MSNRHSYERYEIPDIKGRKHAVVLFPKIEVRFGTEFLVLQWDL